MPNRQTRKPRKLGEKNGDAMAAPPSEDALSEDLNENLCRLRGLLGKSPDIVMRRFIVDVQAGLEAAIVFVDGLVDKETINSHVLRPLMINLYNCSHGPQPLDLAWIEEHLVTVNDTKRNSSFAEAVNTVLNGDTLLLLQGYAETLQIASKGWDKREISEPDAEVIVKGPREGFIENLRTNTALLRRKIRHPDLTFENMRIGRKTRTDVCLAYIRGIAREDLVTEVRRRLDRIDTDSILSTAYLAQFIEDAAFSIFSTTTYTERPDVAAAKILEGRIAIMINGSPVVYTVPTLFMESFQSPDDYNFRPLYATFIRWTRFLAFALTVFLPALFVALTTFNQELIPTPLLINIAAASDATPFPAVLEVVGMGVIFEILREAGVRIPRSFGPAVSIVGGLVIGEAAVGAGLIGQPTVIVVALTAITSYVVPLQIEASAFLRLGMAIVAGIFGLFGILQCALLILIHLASLRSFGVPYLSPLAPLQLGDLKDTLVRVPHWAMLTRPRSLEPEDTARQKPGARPHPPKEGKK